jgi:hypothetical protein
MRWFRKRGRIQLLVMGGIALVGLMIAAGALKHHRSAKRERIAAEALERSENEEQRGDLLAAARSLEAYLALRPLEDRHYLRLANLQAEGATNAEEQRWAITYLYRALAVANDEEKLHIRPRLCQLLLRHERYFEAEHQAEQLLHSVPDHPAGLRCKAIAHFKQYQAGQLDHLVPFRLSILDDIAAAQKANPANPELALVAAQALRDPALSLPYGARLSTRQREAMADAYVDALVAEAPEDPLVWFARYEYRQRYRLPNANDDLLQAARLAPDDRNIKQALARFLKTDLELGIGANQRADANLAEIERAVRFYEEMLAAPEDDTVELFADLGDLHLLQGNREEAIVTWKRGIENGAYPATILFGKLAAAYLASGDLESAALWLDKVDADLAVANPVPGDEVHLALKRDQSLRRGEWHRQGSRHWEAIPCFNDVLVLQEQIGGSSREVSQANVALAELHSTLGDWEAAAAACDRVALERANSPEAWVAASAAHLKAGQTTLAISRADHACALESNGRTLLQLAAVLLAEQRLKPSEYREWERLEKVLREAESKADDVAETERLLALKREMSQLRRDKEHEPGSFVSRHGGGQ